MGRSSTSSKRPQGTAANQHNPKHENGVVGPGKRIQKQKSNGQLNGNAKTSEQPPPTPPLPPIAPATNGHARPTTDAASDSKLPTDTLRRPSLGGSSESSSSESYQQAVKMSAPQESHRQIDVNAAKNPAVHRDAGPLTFLVTVLRSCPLYDTIAILIVLLQIPPTFLSIIHLLFATLTFVPPSTSSNSSFSFTDIFEGALGTPSVATIVAVDLLVLLVWLFLWGPLQDIALDLAQTVIALTLGGGTTGKDAGFNNVLVCLGVVGVSQLANNGNLKNSSLRTLLRKGMTGTDSDDPLEPEPSNANKGPHGWIRTVLAVHILTQGVVRYIRDWYVRRERRDSMISALGDPEAAKGALPHPETSVQDSNSSSTPPVIDVEPMNTLSTTNMTDKSLNPKKKRKASAMVRIRQPIWSALASTKIVMAKEYETSRTASESAGTNATDINNLGNAPFNTEADRIWITDVGFDEVRFSTSYFPTHLASQICDGKNDSPDMQGIDKTKPFFVRVNKTIWQPTRIHITSEGNCSDVTNVSWGGEIFGLAPMSNYQFDFISNLDGSVIFATSVRTMQAPTSDAAPTPTLPSSAQHSARPDSPTTTLKNSIAASEAKLNDERNRQKRERKEQKTKINAVRKEIEKLTTTIGTAGGSDDRLRQKVQQSNLHAKQAEEALSSLVEQLRMLENLPEDDAEEWRVAKAAWQSQKETHKVARSEFNEAKLSADRELQGLVGEATTTQQKRERMLSRINKLNGELDRIADANARGLDEAQRKATERSAKEAERARIEMMYMERLDTLAPQINDMQQALTGIWASIHSIQQADFLAAQAQAQAQAQVQAQQSPTTSIPHSYDTPEAAASNTSYPWNPPNFVPSYGPSMVPFAQPPGRTRGRSSSMLSNVSGFTQSSAEDAPLNRDPREMIQRERQKSGGSSGSGTSGSVGDPKSPVTGMAKANPVPNWSAARDDSLRDAQK